MPPFPGAEARADRREGTGQTDHRHCLPAFAAEPFAAASTAQVHKAELQDGTPVVVKIQRPNIVPTINADLEILGELIETLQGALRHRCRTTTSAGIFQEFAKNLKEELDYRIESFNARRLADTMAEFPEVTVPAMYGHLTTAKVLTMGYVEGVKIIKTEEIEQAGWDTKPISSLFLRA